MFEQSQYLGAVNAKFGDALSALQSDERRTQDAQKGLRSEQSLETKTLRQLASARDAAPPGGYSVRLLLAARDEHRDLAAGPLLVLGVRWVGGHGALPPGSALVAGDLATAQDTTRFLLNRQQLPV